MTALIYQIKQSNDQLMQENEKLNEENVTSRLKLQEMESKILALKQSEILLAEQVKEKKLDLASLQASLKFKDEHLSELKRKNDSLQSIKDANFKKICQLEESIACKDLEINLCRQTIEDFEEMQAKPLQISEDIQKELSLFKSENECLRKQIAIQDQQICKYQQEKLTRGETLLMRASLYLRSVERNHIAEALDHPP